MPYLALSFILVHLYIYIYVNLLCQYGGFRVAILNGVTIRGMWFQTSWNFHLFYQIFVCHGSSKESIMFILFHNKIWLYDDATTAIWQNQIIVIAYSIFLKGLNKEWFSPWEWEILSTAKINEFLKKRLVSKDTSCIMSFHCCYRITLLYLPK